MLAQLSIAGTVGGVEVDGVSPRRAVVIGEVRTEGGEVVPLGPEVVVDDIEQHREPGAVGGIDEGAQIVGVAVLGVG